MTSPSTTRAAAFRCSRRISITLPHHVASGLQDRCDDEGRSLSNLAAYLLETALSHEPLGLRQPAGMGG